MVGTANSTVAWCCRTAAARPAAVKREPMCAVPPAMSTACTPPRPCWWNSGRAWASTSSSCHPQDAMATLIEVSSARWVSGTALGLPVVPEV